MGKVVEFPEIMPKNDTNEVEETQPDVEVSDEVKSDELIQVYANLIWGKAQTSVVPYLIEQIANAPTIEEFTPVVEAIVSKEANDLVQTLDYEFCCNVFKDIATREGLGFLAENPARYLKKAMIKEFIIKFLEIMTTIQMTVAANTLFSTMYQASIKAAKASAVQNDVAEVPSAPADSVKETEE